LEVKVLFQWFSCQVKDFRFVTENVDVILWVSARYYSFETISFPYTLGVILVHRIIVFNLQRSVDHGPRSENEIKSLTQFWLWFLFF